MLWSVWHLHSTDDYQVIECHAESYAIECQDLRCLVVFLMLVGAGPRALELGQDGRYADPHSCDYVVHSLGQ